MSEPRRAVVFVHGAGGGGWEWDAWARVFAAEGWRVFAPDLQPAAEGLAATRLDDYRGLTVTSVAEEKRFNPRLGGDIGVAIGVLHLVAEVVLVLTRTHRLGFGGFVDEFVLVANFAHQRVFDVLHHGSSRRT